MIFRLTMKRAAVVALLGLKEEESSCPKSCHSGDEKLFS